MILSKRTIFVVTIVCILMGNSLGTMIGYLVQEGSLSKSSLSDLPAVVGYSFLSPIIVFSPWNYSGQERVCAIGVLLLSCVSVLALYKKMPIVGLAFAFGASLILGTVWGMCLHDALSA